jgi:hypothetical protein
VSTVKNVSGVALDVPLLDRVVEVDEVVDVPDFQADGVSPLVWPSVHWEPVTDAPPAPAPAVEPAPEGAAE